MSSNGDNYKYREGQPTDRYPPNFENWPLQDQLDHVVMTQTRKGLISNLLSHAGMDPNQYDLQDDTKLRKKELGAILLTLEGKNNGGE